MNNELKKEIRGYYLNNMEELKTLVNDMYAYTGNSALKELMAYPMDEINYLLDTYTMNEILESIDYENFCPFHSWYKWDYKDNLISLHDEQLEDEYKSCILEILDVLFTYIDYEGLENAINNFYLSDNVIEIINNFNKDIDMKKAYCIRFEINQLSFNDNFSKKSMQIIEYYNNTFESDILNRYEEYKEF